MTPPEQGTRSFFEQMVDLIEREGLSFEQHGDASAVCITHQGADVEWECIAQVWEDERVFVCYSVSPLRPTAETLAAAGEFVHLTNIGVLVGNFELDLSDGEIRFKTSVGFGPSAWSDEIARVVLYTNLAAMDHYALGLLQVVTGAASASETLSEIS